MSIFIAPPFVKSKQGTAFAVPWDSQLASSYRLLASAAKAAEVCCRFGTAKKN
jgi:hypothetical protein